MNSPFFALVVLPLLIFTARIIDVSLGTLRIIYLAKGQKILVPVLGFFEVFIWIIAIGQIMQNVDNFLYYFAYAAGFASGNFVGIYIEEKLAIGTVVFRIFTRSDDNALYETLKENEYRVTIIDAEGARGKVKILFTIVKRKKQREILSLIREYNPDTFYTIDEVKVAHEDNGRATGAYRDRYNQFLFLRRRKGK